MTQNQLFVNTSLQAKMTEPFYRPELDILRLSAFLMVFLGHTLPHKTSDYIAITQNEMLRSMMIAAVNACVFGLPLFFFLSAFLLTTLFGLEYDRKKTFDVKRFYIRRILRIWPLYFFAISLGVLLEHNYILPYAANMFVTFTYFGGNIFFLSHAWNSNPFDPLWSISMEEQFYVLFPLIFFFIKDQARLIFGAGCALVALSAIHLVFQGAAHLDADRVIWVNPLTQIMFFGAGMAFAAVVAHKSIKLTRVARWLLSVSGLLLFFVAAYCTDAKHIGPTGSGFSVVMGYLLVCAGCISIFCALCHADVASFPVGVYLGKISFGLYVFHLLGIWYAKCLLYTLRLPINGAPTIIIGFFFTVVLASASYRYLEKPFLKLRKRFTVVANRPI